MHLTIMFPVAHRASFIFQNIYSFWGYFSWAFCQSSLCCSLEGVYTLGTAVFTQDFCRSTGRKIHSEPRRWPVNIYLTFWASLRRLYSLTIYSSVRLLFKFTWYNSRIVRLFGRPIWAALQSLASTQCSVGDSPDRITRSQTYSQCKYSSFYG
jgi:hypothetical protein